MNPKDKKQFRKELKSRSEKLRNLRKLNGWITAEILARTFHAMTRMQPASLGYFAPGFDIERRDDGCEIVFKDKNYEQPIFKLVDRSNRNVFERRDEELSMNADEYYASFVVDTLEVNKMYSPRLSSTLLVPAMFCQVMDEDINGEEGNYHLAQMLTDDEAMTFTWQSEDLHEEFDLIIYRQGVVEHVRQFNKDRGI